MQSLKPLSTYLAVLPDLAGDVVTAAEFVAESLSLVVKEQTSNAAESLSSQELDLRLGVLGVNETSRVDLDLLHVDCAAANVNGHLVSVTGGVVAIGGGEVVELRTVLLDEGSLGKVGSVSTSGENDGSVGLVGLALAVLVFNADDALRVAFTLSQQ